MEKWAILVAGGSGQRMGAQLPKQFLEINGKIILAHSVEAFLNYLKDISKIRLVIPENHFDTWLEKCPEHLKNITLVNGGENRFQSVQNGLNTINSTGVVAIHDGVRPFVSERLISIAYQAAIENGSAIPFIPFTDSVRKLENNSWIAYDRSNLKAVQTPQVFNTYLLKKAYSAISFSNSITDDTMVFEMAGHKPNFIDGEIQNIKITTPFDLLVGEAILKSFKR